MLENKVILITGASRGIGRGVAKHLAAQGAELILLSRTKSDLESLYDEIIQDHNPKPSLYPFNLCSATLEDYDDLRRAIDQKYGRLDGLIHNAGILGALSPIEHYNIQTWYQVLQVNLNSPFILTQALMPLLKKSPSASIIFTLADVASNPKANWGAYAVASSGVKTMMEMLMMECSNITNIRINAVQPHRINTKLRREAYPAEDVSKLLEPTEIVDEYLRLISDISINGTTSPLAQIVTADLP